MSDTAYYRAEAVKMLDKYDRDTIQNLMDGDLCRAIHHADAEGHLIDNNTGFLGVYLKCHFKKYGEEFQI